MSNLSLVSSILVLSSLGLVDFRSRRHCSSRSLTMWKILSPCTTWFPWTWFATLPWLKKDAILSWIVGHDASRNRNSNIYCNRKGRDANDPWAKVEVRRFWHLGLGIGSANGTVTRVAAWSRLTLHASAVKIFPVRVFINLNFKPGDVEPQV